MTVWAAKIDENSKDIFRLQDNIAAQVIDALSIRLGNAEQEKLAKRGTNNIDAYGAYLKGRILWNKRTPDALKQSLTHLNSAIEQDPLYALAYAGLADSYVLLGEYNLALPDETFPKAKAAAQKALELDPNLGEARTVFAYTLTNYAMRCLQKAFDEHIRYVAYIDVDPSFDNLREEPRFQELRRRLGLQA